MNRLMLCVSLIAAVTMVAGIGCAEEDDIFARHEKWVSKVQLAHAGTHSKEASHRKAAVNNNNEYTDCNYHTGGIIYTDVSADPVAPDIARAILEGRQVPERSVYDSWMNRIVSAYGGIHDIAGDFGSFSIGPGAVIRIDDFTVSCDMGAVRDRLASDVAGRIAAAGGGGNTLVVLVNGIWQQAAGSDASMGIINCSGAVDPDVLGRISAVSRTDDGASYTISHTMATSPASAGILTQKTSAQQ